MPDLIIVGGGVVGLSIAWELAGHGLSVRVLEQNSFGQEASWAGAGMLPPGNLALATTSEARLRGAAHQLWPDWSESLTALTGKDNEFHRCGGVELRLGHDGDRIMTDGAARMRAEGVVVECQDLVEIRQRFPKLGPEVSGAYYMPDFCQVRNPRHLSALMTGCALRNVELVPNSPVHHFEISNGRVEAVHCPGQAHHSDQLVIATGAWSGELSRQLGIELRVEPIKGQMVLLQQFPLPFQSVIQMDREYLVPRRDGRILVGSTEEKSGFDKRNTAAAIGELIEFARRVVPGLKDAQFEKCWAGLRPYSAIGRPYIGRLPQLKNVSVATGHFRYGLHLSPITAILIRQILLGQSVLLPLECTLDV